MTRVAIREEEWHEARPEIALLVGEHWKEIARDHAAVPLDPDWERYREINYAGKLAVVTARAEGKLVGYFIGIVDTHLHYQTTAYGWADVFYLTPKYRKGLTGYRLLSKAVEACERRGAVKLSFGTKVHKDMGILLERLGFKETERLFTKVK